MFAVEALRPPPDSRCAQGRDDARDSPLDPPRRHDRHGPSPTTLTTCIDTANSDDDQRKPAGGEDQLRTSGHLGDGEREGPDGSGDDALAQTCRLGEGTGRIVSPGDPRPRGRNESLDDPVCGLLDRRATAARTILEVRTTRPTAQGRR
ncbi:hypothetical protein [Brevibacterium siliguriense]|uniref:hypothetical protein n=1 Tax=Brevibacterium siliguriense TaxID=1136497 RepID=UPI001E2ED757|nr:hypothetical protein [Brevibacterium siliguriense]